MSVVMSLSCSCTLRGPGTSVGEQRKWCYMFVVLHRASGVADGMHLIAVTWF